MWKSPCPQQCVRQASTVWSPPHCLPKSFHVWPQGDIMSRGGGFLFLDKLSSEALLSKETNSASDFYVLVLQYELSWHHQITCTMMTRITVLHSILHSCFCCCLFLVLFCFCYWRYKEVPMNTLEWHFVIFSFYTFIQTYRYRSM